MLSYISSPSHTITIMTSSNVNIFRVTGHFCGEFPAQRPVTRRFDVFFDQRLNKRLSKQSWGWWFETPLRSLQWRHNAATTHEQGGVRNQWQPKSLFISLPQPISKNTARVQLVTSCWLTSHTSSVYTLPSASFLYSQSPQGAGLCMTYKWQHSLDLRHSWTSNLAIF